MDEFEQQIEDTAIADPVDTNEEATPSEPESPPADTAEDAEQAAKPARGVQKRIDELVRQREEERREKERLLAIIEQSLPKQPQTPAPADGKPVPDQFEDYESYLEALVDWKSDQKISQREQVRERQTSEQQKVSAFQEQVARAREQYADFEAVAFNPSLPISEHMQAVILDSDQGAALAYHLGKHPGEAARIAQLPPMAAARELGRIEATLQAPAAPRRASSAPEPITPVGTREAASRDPSKMTTEEWMAWRNTQLRK